MNLIKLTTSFLLLALVSGCYKDKGNYSYLPINGINIKDSSSKTLIAIGVGDTLKLTPKIEQTLQADSLSYEWFVYDNTPSSAYNLPQTVIARTRNLAYKIDVATFTLGRNYKLTYKVTDLKTGVSSFLLYNLLISNDFREGWLVLENINGVADLSIVLPSGKIVHHLYSGQNASSPLNDPLRLEMTSFDVTDALSASGKRMYLVSAGDAVELNYLTFEKRFNYEELFFKAPVPKKPQYINWFGYYYRPDYISSGGGIIINNGQLHYNLTGGFPGAKMWGAELLNPDGRLDYQIYPFVAGGYTYNAAYSVVVYDNVYKRFYVVGSTGLKSFPITASNDVFDMNNVGMDMVYMDSSNVHSQYNAIFQKDETPYYIRFSTVASVAAPVVTLTKALINTPDILNAGSLTSSTITPHIYYSIDNKVFRYETTSNTVALVYSFPEGENITKLRYRKGIPGLPESCLVAATWNGTEGKLYEFTVSPVGGISVPDKEYVGFQKIVDVNYKLP